MVSKLHRTVNHSKWICKRSRIWREYSESVRKYYFFIQEGISTLHSSRYEELNKYNKNFFLDFVYFIWNLKQVFLYLFLKFDYLLGGISTHCAKNVRIRSYSGPYFYAFGLNTERYSLSLHIQSKCEKLRNRVTPNTDTFYAVTVYLSTNFSFDWMNINSLIINDYVI